MVKLWKSINGYEGIYEVSNFGEVRSVTRTIIDSLGRKTMLKGKVRSTPLNTHGYPSVSLAGEKQKIYRVHTLVWDAFGNKPRDGRKLQIDHIDGDKTNNNINNLQLLTNRQNVSKSKKNRDLPTGVYQYKNRYRTNAVLNGVACHLGYYATPKEASAVYLEAVGGQND